VGVCQDYANIHKRLVLREQSQLDLIADACLLKVSQMLCVVNMSLRVQIPVTDFDGMVEVELRHAVDYTVSTVFWTEGQEIRKFVLYSALCL
jgi:hypothetical protein